MAAGYYVRQRRGCGQAGGMFVVLDRAGRVVSRPTPWIDEAQRIAAKMAAQAGRF